MGMRAPQQPVTANAAQGTAERAASATAPAVRAGEAAAKAPKLGKMGAGMDTPKLAGAITIAAVVGLVLLRAGFAGVLGD